MKKGDLRKQEILKTAETLFCRYGYEQTSVQDILDVLHASKGSFYHHFVSKESLLEAMFSVRAEQALKSIASEAEEDPVKQVNRLISAVVPLQEEQLSFLLMLLPIFSLPEGRTMKTSYCDALARSFRQPLADAILLAAESGVMLTKDPEISSEQCLLLTNHFWIRVCEMIVQNENDGKETDHGDVLHLTELYRRALEQILTAPYGSVTLTDVPSIRNLTDRIHAHWRKH